MHVLTVTDTHTISFMSLNCVHAFLFYEHGGKAASNVYVMKIIGALQTLHMSCQQLTAQLQVLINENKLLDMPGEKQLPRVADYTACNF